MCCESFADTELVEFSNFNDPLSGGLALPEFSTEHGNIRVNGYNTESSSPRKGLLKDNTRSINQSEPEDCDSNYKDAIDSFDNMKTLCQREDKNLLCNSPHTAQMLLLLPLPPHCTEDKKLEAALHCWNDSTEREKELEEKNDEIKNLKLRMISASQSESNQSDLQRQLEEAKLKIRDLESQVLSDTSQAEKIIQNLKQQLATLQYREEEVSKKELELQKRMQSSKEMEFQILGLRRMNMELKQQKRELAMRLASVEDEKMTELIPFENKDDGESTILETEVVSLREQNESLMKQVEGLQSSRFSEVEELVYLRWVNACLRYELHSVSTGNNCKLQLPVMFTALDLNKCMSPRSQEKAKKLMLEYSHPNLVQREHMSESEFESISSLSSSPSDTTTAGGELEDINPSLDGEGRRPTSSLKKPGFIHKLKIWSSNKQESKLTSISSNLLDRRSSVKVNPANDAGLFHISHNSLEALLLRNSSDAVAITTFGRNKPQVITHSKSAYFSYHRQSSSDSFNSQSHFPLSENSPLARNSASADDKLVEPESSVAASFQVMSKTVSGVLEDKYPSFKDRHKLQAQPMEENASINEGQAKEVIKLEVKPVMKQCFGDIKPMKISTVSGKSIGKVPEISAIEKVSIRSEEASEVKKLGVLELEKRAPRVPRPAPKPSITTSSINSTNTPSKQSEGGVILSASAPSPPPPPPPPPPPLPLSRSFHPRPPHLQASGGIVETQDLGVHKVKRSPGVVEFYQSLMKREPRQNQSSPKQSNLNVVEARNHIIGEIENRSTFLLAVKADVENQKEFVQSLAIQVQEAFYSNIDDVVKFVKWLDEELSFLVDERAVLKHFEWPERKADTMREAAFQYRDFKSFETTITSFKDDPHHLPFDSAHRNMLNLLEKAEKNVFGLQRTRDAMMPRFKEFKIPTDWLLDSGIISKIKLASVQLARKYMTRVAVEIDNLGNFRENEPLKEYLLLQGVRFAFRVHQFAGGFDAESMEAFEDLRSRNHSHGKGQSEE